MKVFPYLKEVHKDQQKGFFQTLKDQQKLQKSYKEQGNLVYLKKQNKCPQIDPKEIQASVLFDEFFKNVSWLCLLSKRKIQADKQIQKNIFEYKENISKEKFLKRTKILGLKNTVDQLKIY